MLEGTKYEIVLKMQEHKRMIFIEINPVLWFKVNFPTLNSVS
jgi:hypothetical protein